MELLNQLGKNTIVITNYGYKESILKELSKDNNLYNISFLTMKELTNRYYFSYDYNTIYYLMDKYNYKYDVAKLYLDNLYYIDDKKYNIPKLDKLVSIKKELEDNNLLIKDDLFREFIQNKKIIFYGFNYFKSFELDLIEKLKDITEVEVIEKAYNKYNHTVYEFDTMEEEVEYVAISILKLLEEGISINAIKITNFSNDYLDIVDRIFSFYNLAIDYNNDKLISTKVVKDFFDLDGSIEERISSLNDKYKNNKVLEELISVVNKYISFNNQKVVLDMIWEELKNRTLLYDKTSNMIEIIDYKNDPINDNDYVFMIGFNQSTIPIVYKDEDYITDNIKNGLLLDSVNSLNIKERECTINNISNIRNLIITYKNLSYYDTFYPSNLIEDLNLVVEKKSIDRRESYSNIGFKIILGKLIDEYLRTGVITDNLKLLYSNIDLPYMSYDNTFKGIEKNDFNKYINNSYNLSYSSISNFYKCPFRYYVTNVLKLDIFEDNFAAYLGSLFHYVLENNLKNSTDTKTLIKSFIKSNERELTIKEKFFVEKTEKDINFALDVIKEHLEKTNLKTMLFENKIEVEKEGNISVTFKGFIDKMMYKEDGDKTILCIIDYKTGYVDTDLRKVPFGLSMQLPIYLYLASNSDLKNISFAGFYIQRVLNNEVSISSNKTYEELKKENLKLSGYSNSDIDIIKEFDPTYNDSEYIKSLKTKKDGSFYNYSSVLNNFEIDNLISLVDSKIDEAIDEINNCNFKISPKTTVKENIGCKYCKFYDICFKETKDLEYITPYKDLSFLGGDYNA